MINAEASLLHLPFEELKQHAAKENVEVDPSFFAELKNYSRHDIVRELPSPDLHRALVGIGSAAIGRSREKVGAGAVRIVITELCNDPFSTCSLAAARILEAHRQGGEVKGGLPIDFELPTDPFSRSRQ